MPADPTGADIAAAEAYSVTCPDHPDPDKAGYLAGVMAERERAAKLIEGYATDQPGVGITYHGEALANAIRMGPQQ